MAENAETSGQIPQDLAAETTGDDDPSAIRKVKPSPRRGWFAKKAIGAVMTAGLILGPNIADAPHQTDKSAEVKAGHTGHELPTLPEFTSPDKDQRVLVIPMFGNGEDDPGSIADLETLLENVGLNYKENSFGNLQYKFTVLPWQKTQLPDTDGRFGKYEEIARIGNSLTAVGNVPNLDKFQTRMYVLSPDTKVGEGGLGLKRVPNNYNEAWIFTEPQDLKDPYGSMASVTKHELGHTLGMTHSNSIDATGVKKEYGGAFDTMGQANSAAITFNAPQRVAMGWVRSEHIRSITEDGVYKLNPLDVTHPDLQDATQVLRLQKPDTDERYYVSLRAEDLSFGNINIHEWDENPETAPNEILTPATEKENGWKEGDEFYDAKNGIRIKMISKKSFFSRTPDAGEVQLQVTFDKK